MKNRGVGLWKQPATTKYLINLGGLFSWNIGQQMRILSENINCGRRGKMQTIHVSISILFQRITDFLMKSKMENKLKISNRTKNNMQIWFHKTFTLVLIKVCKISINYDII